MKVKGIKTALYSAIGGGFLVSSLAAGKPLESSAPAGQFPRLVATVGSEQDRPGGTGGSLSAACVDGETRAISLAGTWSCRLDPLHRGMGERWQNGTVEEHRVHLPGTTHTNGIGPKYDKKQISNLTPVTNHVGPAWYWRDVVLSESDCSRLVELSLERCCWESFVWLNGKPLGTRDSLVSPHAYDLSPAVKPGMNRLTVMIDNSNLKNKAASVGTRMAETEELVMVENAEKRLNCGGHHTLFLGYTWNGITGHMDLRIRPRVRISPPQVYPNVGRKRIVVKCVAINDFDKPVAATLTVSAGGLDAQGMERHATAGLELAPGRHPVTVEVDMGEDVRLWNEHTPQLYRLEASLASIHGADRHETEFGMREISQAGNQLEINGKPTFLRGMLEKSDHPLTG